MIKEEYVSLEVAKLLKDKGFDQKCSKYCMPGLRLYTHTYGEVIPKGAEIIEVPTQAMAMRWLREMHNIKVNIFYNNSNYAIEYFEPNTQTGVGKFVFIGDGYDVYEQACEVAIKYCLENLI